MAAGARSCVTTAMMYLFISVHISLLYAAGPDGEAVAAVKHTMGELPSLQPLRIKCNIQRLGNTPPACACV
jgi:hypothetical protein